MATHLLLIEGNPGDAWQILALFMEADADGFVADYADCLSAGVEKQCAHAADAVILALSLPDGQGLDTFSRLQARFPEVPVVVLTGLKDQEVGCERCAAAFYVSLGAAQQAKQAPRPDSLFAWIS